VPDLLVAGKGMAGGLPFGMVGGRIDVLNAGSMGMATRNSSTFGGNPVVCAAGHKTIDVLTNQGLIENGRLIGDQLIMNLRTRLMNLRCVKDIRGLGLLIGVEIHSPPKGSIPIDDMLRAILTGLLERGVVISSSSPVIRITPPLTLTQDQANYIAETLETVLTEVIEPEFSVP
jgi:4-aminobutyrate aminotransferase-like enzyme